MVGVEVEVVVEVGVEVEVEVEVVVVVEVVVGVEVGVEVGVVVGVGVEVEVVVVVGVVIKRKDKNMKIKWPKFDGETYVEELDCQRLNTQLEKVRSFLLTKRVFTLKQLAKLAGGSEAGVSARVRDLRKGKFGGYVINRTRNKKGLHFYQLVES